MEKENKKGKVKSFLKNSWHFIWQEDSVLSWIVNIILAFVLIKFVVFPLLGLILSTSHPIVAVVSESMDHDIDSNYMLCGERLPDYKNGFDNWWEECGGWYEERNISKNEFMDFEYSNGFRKGDIMILKGKKAEEIEVGEILVFNGGRKNPIIHRIVSKSKENGKYYFQTKGDHNEDSIRSGNMDETRIGQERIVGTALIRIPFLGWIKIIFVNFLKIFGLNMG